MSKANVRPKCRYEGRGRTGNSVSAQASLVERSNGETGGVSFVTCRGGSMTVVELSLFKISEY